MMSGNTGEEFLDAECTTNLRAFHDIRAWCMAIKPWSEFFRFSQFGFPSKLNGYITRLKKNFSHFMANYTVISAILMIPVWILYVAAIFITLPLFIYAEVGYILYCAMGISILLSLIHASLYKHTPHVLPEVNVDVMTKVDDEPRVAAAEITSYQGITSKRHVLFREIDDADN